LAHTVGESDAPETINAAYISRLLSNDWGFWYTVTTNLKRIKEITAETDILTNEESALIDSHVDALLQHIETHPKTIKWKMRSKIGTRQRWYEPVETAETVGDFGIWRLKEPPKESKGKESAHKSE
jgi:hypothetical protein